MKTAYRNQSEAGTMILMEYNPCEHFDIVNVFFRALKVLHIFAVIKKRYA